jgi:phytoene/squalene synthetase
MKNTFDTLSASCSKTTTKLYSTSFSLGIHFLDPPLRGPVYAIYGFVRLADEIVDSFHDYNKTQLLEEFRQDCFTAIDRGISLNPVLNSFQQVVRQYRVKHELIEQFLESMRMDLLPQRYDDQKYERYILGSAQVVGLMCLQVFTGGDESEYQRLKEPAMLLGSAFQKVNFLRDLRLDHAELNRSYFPGIDVPHFSNAEKIAIEQDIERDFSGALKGILTLPRSSRKGVYMAYVYYTRLFRKIRLRTAEDVLSERIRVSNTRKLLLMLDSLIRYNLNIL